jgi:hypothetical protein
MINNFERVAIFGLACAIAGLIIFIVTSANAQGIYMLNGRATPSVIVGNGGAVFPVIPGPQFAGPSPLIIAPPLPWGAPPLAYAPPDQPLPAPPPPPLGWVFGRYTACIEPDCRSVIVSVGADGLNVRMAPNGPIVLALANGVPVVPLQRQGDWLLVTAACPLVPTFTWSITAGGIPLSICP